MSSKEEIKIDVIIPSYNGAKFIEAAVTSVLKQSYPATRLIIIDDGSTDNTKEIIEKILAKNNTSTKIVYHYQENKGLSAARNKGIEISNSPFLAFLDSDDVWKKNKLERQVNGMQNTDLKNVGLIYCNYEVIDENGIKIDSAEIIKADPSMRGNVFDKLCRANVISGSGSAILVKKECFNAAGTFDEHLKACEDWDMWLRISEKYEFDFVTNTLVEIRQHASSMQKDPVRMLENTFLFYKKWISKVSDKEALREWAFYIAKYVMTPSYSNERKENIKKIFADTELKKLFFKTKGSMGLYLLAKRFGL